MLKGKEIGSLTGALLLAFFIWFVHTMSLKYTDYVQYSVEVDSDIEGHSGVALANETLFLRGEGVGFRLLRQKFPRNGRTVIHLKLEESLLHPVEGAKDSYYVKTSEIREKIIEAVSSSMTVDFIENQTLTFVFPEKSFKKVAVNPTFDIRCKSQYMVISDIGITPDSVMVSGNVKDLEEIEFIDTRPLVFRDLSKTEQGVIALEQIPGVRISDKEVSYSIPVGRYVENKSEVQLAAINVPGGKKLTLLPSKVTVTYRVPFAQNTQKTDGAPQFVVDYNVFINSRSLRVIPQFQESNGVIYSYSIDPPVVECILTE